MFRKFDLVVGVDKKVIDKIITNPSEYGWKNWSVRFMNVARAFIHLLGNTNTKKSSEGRYEYPRGNNKLEDIDLVQPN